MSKVFTIVGTLLLSGAVALAQTGSAGGAGNEGSPESGTSGASQGSDASRSGSAMGTTGTKTGADQTRITGCLSGTQGSYTLTTTDGMAYRLQGHEADLREEIGHQVAVELEASPSYNSNQGGSTGQAGGIAGTASARAGSSTSTSDASQSGAIAGRPDGASGSSGMASETTRTVQVKDINKIADSCTSGQSSTPGAASGATSGSGAGTTQAPQPN
jgi:hypothetical protein